jgi:hypothetical protein
LQAVQHASASIDLLDRLGSPLPLFAAPVPTPRSAPPDSKYPLIHISWVSPTVHRWWARSIHLYLNERR